MNKGYRIFVLPTILRLITLARLKINGKPGSLYIETPKEIELVKETVKSNVLTSQSRLFGQNRL